MKYKIGDQFVIGPNTKELSWIIPNPGIATITRTVSGGYCLKWELFDDEKAGWNDMLIAYYLLPANQTLNFKTVKEYLELDNE